MRPGVARRMLSTFQMRSTRARNLSAQAKCVAALARPALAYATANVSLKTSTPKTATRAIGAVPTLYELLQTTLPEVVPTWTDVVVRLLAATALGGAIGLDRELTRKPAGLRTHALVSLGAALATASALQLGVRNDLTHADAASRVIQGVVAGIGFIGGGVILHADGRNVKGLTTAASIFVAATLGISCGIGRWRVAASAAGIALVVLTLGRPLEEALHKAKQDDEPPMRDG